MTSKKERFSYEVSITIMVIPYGTIMIFPMDPIGFWTKGTLNMIVQNPGNSNKGRTDRIT